MVYIRCFKCGREIPLGWITCKRLPCRKKYARQLLSKTSFDGILAEQYTDGMLPNPFKETKIKKKKDGKKSMFWLFRKKRKFNWEDD